MREPSSAVNGERVEANRVALRARVDWSLIVLGLVLFATCLEFEITSDGYQRFRDLRGLIEQGNVSSAPYSFVGPLGAAPLYLLGRAADEARAWTGRYNFLIFAAGLAVFYRLIRPVDPAIARSLLLILLAASMFPHHVRDFFGEVFTTVLASAGMIGIGLAGRAWGWGALVLAVANTAASIAGLVLVAIAEIWRRRRLRYLLAVVAAATVVLAENFVRRGDPLVSGYETSRGFETVLTYSGRVGFSYPVVFGLLSVLFSFGKGLFFYAPGLLLPVRGPLAVPHRLLLLFLAGLVLAYAKWWAWYGGWFWGPRFFLVASVPAAIALAVHVARPAGRPAVNVMVLACLAWSTWVAMSGAVFGQYGLETCNADQYQWEVLCWYVPEFSTLFRPFVDPKPLTGADVAILSYGAVVFAWLASPLVAALMVQSRAVPAHMRAAWARGPRLRF